MLDGQLQEAVRKLGIAKSYIETVDKTSRQLKEALEAGKLLRAHGISFDIVYTRYFCLTFDTLSVLSLRA